MELHTPIAENKVIKLDEASADVSQRIHKTLPAKTTLKELQNDLFFFVPGIIFSQLPIASGQDVLFCEGIGNYAFTFDKPLFKGLGVVGGWNHTLFAVDLENKDRLMKHIVGVVFLDIENKLVAKVRDHDLTIADPAVIDNALVLADDLPTVTLTCFGLDTNKGKIYMAHPDATELGSLLVSNALLVPGIKLDPEVSEEMQTASDNYFKLFKPEAE